MNRPQIFSHKLFGDLPVIVINDVEWFGATEAASALTFSDPHKAIANHVYEDDSTVHPVIDSLGRKQQKKFINESGLYSYQHSGVWQVNVRAVRILTRPFPVRCTRLLTLVGQLYQ